MNRPVRIAVLGNSHLAAAKEGWDLIASDHPACELTFFGAPGLMMGDLAIEDRALVPRTGRLRKKLERSSNGLGRIVPADFDRFILYGLQFGPRRLLQLYRTFRPVSFEWRGSLELLHPFRRCADPVQTISEQFFDTAALSALRASHACRLAGHLRALSEAPIHLVAAPGFSELALETGHWDGPLGAGDIARLAVRSDRLMLAACPDEASLLLPPADLTAHGIFTSAAHALAAGEDTARDHTHTAPGYSARMLEAALNDGQIGAGDAVAA